MMIIRSLKPFLILGFLLIAMSLACKFGGSTEAEVAPVEPTPDLNATAQALAEQVISQTQAAKEAQATPTQPEKPTAVPEEPTLASTEEVTSAKKLPEVIGEYFNGTPASYSASGDFDKSWAQIGWYQWWAFEYPSTNFIIRTDVTWTSASDKANWNQSGCGFAFHAQDTKNHYAAYLGLDGIVYVKRLYLGAAKLIGSAKVGKMDIPEGSAELMLMVNGNNIYFFVNGSQVYSGSDTLLTGNLKSGDLGLTINSGTNKDFGTRCQMKNIDLWDLGE